MIQGDGDVVRELGTNVGIVKSNDKQWPEPDLSGDDTTLRTSRNRPNATPLKPQRQPADGERCRRSEIHEPTAPVGVPTQR